ncbi:MAG: hypothetical protein WBG37_13745 [Desulfobacterales bacterium]
MNTPDSNRFKFTPDDEPGGNSLLGEPADEARLDKIQRRMTRLSILLPLLIIVALMGIYWGLSRQVNRTRDTGSIEVLRLSKDLEASFSALSVKQAKLDEMLNKQLAPLNERWVTYEQNDKELKGRLENLEKSLARLSKSKLGPQDLEKASAALTAQISGISQEVKRLNQEIEGNGSSMASQIKDLEVTLDQTVLELADTAVALDEAKGRLGRLQSQLAKLESTQMSPERLNAVLNEMRLNLQDNDNLTLLASEQAVMDKRLNDLEGQLNALREKIAAFSARGSSAPRPIPAPAPAVRTTPGGVQEQDLN